MDGSHQNLLRVCQKKLDEESSHADRDLRLLVGHTRILDALLSVPIPISRLVDQQEDPSSIHLKDELKAPPDSLPIGILATERLEYEVLVSSYD
ncbi:hypothetical protein ETB97_003490 [Aspergillus alliaceus]|uniref:Uncharacterized protein n=1 Tax=Petromyces alliaceus TaxID=209559 RepID=A0A5N6FZZ3_PETAA|nr:uncharacterized protein BDW43DRAFT_274033 [Aspergillus alliaceus]KAB8234384.1 hypothetical protein BDW43DRAFT_274033 [Aspergillus alliaceus]KAE8393466.1 hypothetical protein BDV23DRAFT_149235 [Aspergillus alliaceus]KAF5858999.1 hypothetical protein ETB97_003490 [Aspergillus burnettii]